jgi:pyruvate/2-oxoglutarate dehydrogenase complex dihydrolipoamide dehydrogenase (E3) component
VPFYSFGDSISFGTLLALTTRSDWSIPMIASKDFPSEKYDLVILGSGSGAKLSAWAFAKEGQRVAVVERKYIGGACPNVACLPSKNIIQTALISSYAHRLNQFGLAATDVRVHMPGVRERKRKLVSSEIEEHLRLFHTSGAELILGSGKFVGPKLVEVVTNDGRTRLLEGNKVLIGTGSRAVIDDTPGLRESNPLTHVEALELDVVPSNLVILGAGYVGLEFAQAMRRFGSRVTLVHHGERILKQEDLDVSEAVHTLLTDEGIEVLLEASVAKVSGESGVHVSLEVNCKGTRQIIEGTHILVTTGRTPNTDGLGLELAGIETTEDGYVRVNDRLQTTAPGVWAVGDVAGSPKFTHVSADDFRIFKINATGGDVTTNGRTIPFCLFLDPELARIGLNEAEAKANGIAYRLFKLPMTGVLRAQAIMETRGFMKALVAQDSDKILGFTSFGVNAGDVMAAVQMAMIAGLPYTAFRDAILAHPTMAEGLEVLFLSQPADHQGRQNPDER